MLLMQAEAGVGDRRWAVRGGSRLSLFGLVVFWLCIAAGTGLVCAGVRATHLANAAATVALAIIPLVRAAWMWWRARGERYGIDLDSGELFGRWNRWSLARFRSVELRHSIDETEARRTWRKQGWSVVMLAGLDDPGVVVYESAHDFRAWRVAEKFARCLGLPMIDASGDSPMTRHSHELDVSLLDRLRKLETSPDPGAPPAGVQQSVDGGRLQVTTRVFSGSYLSIAMLAGAVIAAPLAVVWPWGFLVLPVVGAVGAIIAVPAGACRLEVDAERVFVAGPMFRGRRSIPIAAIEAVRLFGAGARTRVCFVSDRGIVSLPLRASDFVWLRARLFHWWTGGASEASSRSAIYR